MGFPFPSVIRALLVAAALPWGIASAQTITLSPSKSESVGLTGFLQFSATVKGVGNTGVTWYVNGTKGGSAGNGTISAAGLYIAPATVPSHNPVTIKAVSEGEALLTASVSVTVNNAIAFPVTSHPRLWITQADLPKLQSRAVSTNPVYKKAMAPLLAQAVSDYQSEFFPGGKPNPKYPDPGDTQGYTGILTEEVGMILAFNSLIDPVPANRIKYAQYARNLIMYALDQTALGFEAGVPFRDPVFFLYNRGDAVGDQWALIVDWIYDAKDAQGNAILTASDKKTIQKAFLLWAGSCLTASVTGGDSPTPVGAMNNLSLIGGGAAPYRMASNNYYLGHARNLTMIALTLDPGDDAPVKASLSAAVLGNSMRSYIADATGAWLYQTYAMMGEPQQIASQYGLSGKGAGFGLSDGGLPPEGMLYGESFSYVLEQLLALQTAGFGSPSMSGPQVNLATAPVWNRYVPAYLSSMTPSAELNSTATYLGPIYYLASFGDLLRTFVTPNEMEPFAALAMLEQHQGSTTHLAEARWFADNAIQGGMLANAANPWTWGCVQTVFDYMLFDPTAAAAPDPRPTYPLFYFDHNTGRVLSRTDWTTKQTWFDYRASWESINHQQGDAGGFELFRNGEWLTSEMNNYDNNLVGFTPYYLNSLGLQNWCANGTPDLSWNETGIWKNGGQWMWAQSTGDPTTASSNGVGYTYANSNLTDLYNLPNEWTPADAALDIQQATRSILWLDDDYIVVYDRATSKHSGLFKTFNLSLAEKPVISGTTATETMADNQRLFVQTLLPAKPKITSRYAAGDLNPIATFETMANVLTVEDPTLPADARFLHVLQAADPAVSMVPATYVASTKGTAFDGAVFGTMAVFFTHANAPTVTTTTFAVPSTVTTFVLTGLAANAHFSVSATTSGKTTTVTLTPGAAGSLSDAAGVIKAGI